MATKPKRKYTKRAEKWKHTKKAQQGGAGGAAASLDGAAAAPEELARAAADAAMQEGALDVAANSFQYYVVTYSGPHGQHRQLSAFNASSPACSSAPIVGSLGTSDAQDW